MKTIEKVKFKCTGCKCKKSCCGPFKGVAQNMKSLSKHGFSDIALSKKSYDYIHQRGLREHLVRDHHLKMWFIKLNEDKSCPFFKQGQCSIYEGKPPICSAYPLYLDPFGGLAVDTNCEGITIGGQKSGFRMEKKALKEAYELYLEKIK